MGEAKRRANEIIKIKQQHINWLSNLTEEEATIANLAERLEEKLIQAQSFTEGCYHLAFFMTRYLAEKQISVIPVVGWVNDGTWEGVTSHAWIEYNGLKTDVSLTKTSHPEQQPPGSLIVLDHVLKKGKVDYIYYHNNAEEVLEARKFISSTPKLRMIQNYKEQQHKEMMHIAEPGQLKRIDTYLSNAPLGLRFEDLKRIVEE
ncbi:hypothetical protein ACJJIQ_07705 [Microbulbifer sp. ANSA003]|uniref:hypothetical protein n=1 Tax=unclassified Microbulbifer TaxID=2619833 RepID=UPI00403A1C5A